MGILLAALLDVSFCILKNGKMIVVFIESDSTGKNVHLAIFSSDYQILRNCQPFWATRVH